MNYILCALLSLTLVSCYSMPPDDLCSIPLTNNPRVIPQQNGGLNPSVSY